MCSERVMDERERTGYAADAWHRLALQCAERGDLEGAYQQLIRATQTDASMAVYWSDLASVLGMQQRYQESLSAFQKVHSLTEPTPSSCYNLGLTLRHLDRFTDALDVYRQGLRLDPCAAPIYSECLNLCVQLKDWRGVLSFAEQAERFGVATQIDYFLGMVFLAQSQLLIWSHVQDHLASIYSRMAEHRRVVMPGVGLLAMPFTAEQQLMVTAQFQQRLPQESLGTSVRSTAHRPVRIAYISSDFRSHPVLYLTRGLIEGHDRTQFHVYVVSLKAYPQDQNYQDFSEKMPHFLDFSSCRDDEAVSSLRALDLDIAVDLNGITGDARTEYFAKRIAPIQINYLGYPGTMGTACHDYILADPVVIPNHHRPYYSEKVVWLAGCFQSNDRARYGHLARNVPERSRVILASFNAVYKLNPLMFQVWIQIFSMAPQADLWLAVSDPEAQQRLCDYWTAAGLSRERLVFCPTLEYEAHLERLSQVDFILDTLPFCGGTSTADALIMGVPVLTCLGDTFAGRMSASLLLHAGLKELVTTQLEQYIQQAVHLVQQPQLRFEYRRRLQSQTVIDRIFCTKRQVRTIEQAYQAMLHRYRQGLAPDHLDLGNSLRMDAGVEGGC